MKQPKDTYKESEVYKFGNVVVRVNYPDISDEENERRKELVRKAAEKFVRATLIKQREAAKKAVAENVDHSAVGAK
jgi:hypothetical protein